MAGVNRAIPTRYKGILFRSKLEADWAITLDTMGIEWGYELEGRYWGGTYYAPDFWLPRSQQWFEVKGVITPEDGRKWMALVLNWERSKHGPKPVGFPALNPDADSGVWVPPLVVGEPDGVFASAVILRGGIRSRVCLTAVGFVAVRNDFSIPPELDELAEPEAWWGSVFPFPLLPEPVCAG